MPWELDEDTLARHAARIDDEGYTVLEGAIEPELVADLRDAIRRLARELDVQPRGTAAEGVATRRMYNLLAKDAVFQAMPPIATSCRSSSACSIAAACSRA